VVIHWLTICCMKPRMCLAGGPHMMFAPPTASLPASLQAPPTNFFRPLLLAPGVAVCGDHRASATFDGALASGRKAAEALLGSA
jgi:hypothetical protein